MTSHFVICRNCEHHDYPKTAFNGAKCRAAAYGVDPVTGFKTFQDCRKINPDGQCKLYEPKHPGVVPMLKRLWRGF